MTEEQVEENCECGLTEAGLWDEALFDQYGCECNTGERIGYDCGNCGHHWRADQHQESCPKCQSWHVMTTDEWSEYDAA